MPAESTTLLSDIRILDFTFQAAGPYATSLIRALGADVIKVESAARPDPTRGRENRPYQRSVFFDDVNAGKRSIAIDMKAEGGVELARRLAASCHAVVDNFRPGVMDRWGMDFESLRRETPGIVSASLSAMGANGPYERLPGYAGVFAALGGLSSRTINYNGMPTEFRTSIDMRAGAMFALAIVSGLVAAQRTGVGSRIDFSATEAVATLLGTVLARAAVDDAGQDARAVLETFARSSQGDWIAVSVPTAKESTALRALTGDGDAAMALHSWVARHDTADAVDRLRAVGVPAAALADASGLAADPSLERRGFFTRVPGVADERPVLVAAAPWLVDGVRPPVRPSPQRGDRTGEVLRDLLAMQDDEIEDLEQRGVLR